jgi:hypothetical protein
MEVTRNSRNIQVVVVVSSLLTRECDLFLSQLNSHHVFLAKSYNNTALGGQGQRGATLTSIDRRTVPRTRRPRHPDRSSSAPDPTAH